MMQPKCSFNSINSILITISLIVLPIILIITVAYYMSLKPNTRSKDSNDFTEPFENAEWSSPTTIGTANIITNDAKKDEVCNYNHEIYTTNTFNDRDCEVYFVEKASDIAQCDAEKSTNPNSTCKYTFKGWKEFKEAIPNGSTTASSVYDKKQFHPNFTKSIDNQQLVAKCFKPLQNTTKALDYEYKMNNTLVKDCQGGSATEIHNFNNTNYASFKFVNDANAKTNYDNVISSICSVSYPEGSLIRELKNNIYKLNLNSNNNVISLEKGKFDKEQKNFVKDTTYNPKSFVEAGANMLAYNKDTKLFKIYSSPSMETSRDVKILKLRYNYLCGNATDSSPVIEFVSTDAKLKLDALYSFTTAVSQDYSTGNYKDLEGIESNFYITKELTYDPNKLVDKKSLIKSELTKMENERIADILKSINEDIGNNQSLQKSIVDANNEIAKLQKEKEDRQTSRKNYTDAINFNTMNSELSISQGTFMIYKLEKPYEMDMSGLNKAFRKTKVVPGLTYKLFRDGYFDDDIEFTDKKTPKTIKIVQNMHSLENATLGEIQPNQGNVHYYTIEWTGYFYAKETAVYKFGTWSDDASFVYLDDIRVVDNGRPHGVLYKDSPGIEIPRIIMNSTFIMKGQLMKIRILFGENWGEHNFYFGFKVDNSDWIWDGVKQGYLLTDDFATAQNSSGLVSKVIEEEVQPVIKNGYIYYEFVSSNREYELEFKNDTKCEIFMIGGGGGGAENHGGGGGAGAYYYNKNYTFKNGTYKFKVGGGGRGATKSTKPALNGSDTYIQDSSNKIVFKCKGGGAGGNYATSSNGLNGGCGGGANGWEGNTGNDVKYAGGRATNERTDGTGYNGGSSMHNFNARKLGGGGGGGIGSAGVSSSYKSGEGGGGGNGLVINIRGKEEVFGGGGGAGEWPGFAKRPAGRGGGAVLSNGQFSRVGGDAAYDEGNGGENGKQNTGSGGGSAKSRSGGSGATGIIIIKIKMENAIENVSRQEIIKDVLPNNTSSLTKHPKISLHTYDENKTSDGKTIRCKQNINGCCSGDVWRLFTYDTKNSNNIWYHGGLDSYTPSDGYAIDRAYFTDYNGDWIMIDLDEEINLKQIKFYPRPQILSRSPSMFRVYATNDKTKFDTLNYEDWTLIHDTGEIFLIYTNGVGVAVINSNPSNIKYSIYAIVVNKLYGGNGNAYCLNFNEVELYAEEDSGTNANNAITLTNTDVNFNEDLKRFEVLQSKFTGIDGKTCGTITDFATYDTTTASVTISANQLYAFKFISSVFLQAGYYRFKCYLYHDGAVINSSVMAMQTPDRESYVSTCCFFTKIDTVRADDTIRFKYNMWTTKNLMQYNTSGFYNVCFTCYGYNAYPKDIKPSVKFYYDYYETLPTGTSVLSIADININNRNNNNANILGNFKNNDSISIKDFLNPTDSTPVVPLGTRRYPLEPAIRSKISINNNIMSYSYSNGTVIRMTQSSMASLDRLPTWLLWNYSDYSKPNPHHWAESWATDAYYTVNTLGYKKSNRGNIYFRNHSTYYGEWAMIDLNDKIVLEYYNIYAMTEDAHAGTKRAPRDFRIYATNDDNAWNNASSMSWILINEQKGIEYEKNVAKKFTITGNTTAYRYYAIIIYKNNGADNWIQFSKWELYGKAEEIEVVAPTIVGKTATFYNYYAKNEKSIIDTYYKEIYPYSTTKKSNYTAYINSKSDWSTNDIDKSIDNQNLIKDNVKKYFKILAGDITLPVGEKFSYNGAYPVLDSTIATARKIKNALENINYSGLNIPEPAFKENTSIYNVFKKINSQNLIDDEKMITIEKFPKEKLSKDALGTLPADATKSVYFTMA